MLLYRIADNRFAGDLSGTGGLFVSGRWHRQGTRIVYLASSVPLAMLEVLVHTPRRPEGRSLVTVELPDSASVLTVNPDALPKNWRSFPYIDELADMTEQWIAEGKTWLFKIPSAPCPTEFNYLLNPLHQEHSTLRIVSIDPYSFDERLK
ncbi:RES family NAD+ phosphorylase [Fibrella aestuarina]|uniref:RES family NAD+ phosphorylase n=1 Tax=Fibrella aestuarina TaxID=651143 RepID=UPI00059C5616|nr:RES family NAD+ phosphorylase [Fibrella aestuarina]